MKLIGVVDLVLKDEAGRIIAVDNKTAAKPYAQATVDDDNQLTCYAYLLAANRYVVPTAEVHCRLDVLRKLKTPKLEHYQTIRTAAQRRRFAKLASCRPCRHREQGVHPSAILDVFGLRLPRRL